MFGKIAVERAEFLEDEAEMMSGVTLVKVVGSCQGRFGGRKGREERKKEDNSIVRVFF